MAQSPRLGFSVRGPDGIAGDPSAKPTCRLSICSPDDATALMMRSGAVDDRSSQRRRFAYRGFADVTEIDAQQVPNLGIDVGEHVADCDFLVAKSKAALRGRRNSSDENGSDWRKRP